MPDCYSPVTARLHHVLRCVVEIRATERTAVVRREPFPLCHGLRFEPVDRNVSPTIRTGYFRHDTTYRDDDHKANASCYGHPKRNKERLARGHARRSTVGAILHTRLPAHPVERPAVEPSKVSITACFYRFEAQDRRFPDHCLFDARLSTPAKEDATGPRPNRKEYIYSVEQSYSDTRSGEARWPCRTVQFGYYSSRW